MTKRQRLCYVVAVVAMAVVAAVSFTVSAPIILIAGALIAWYISVVLPWGSGLSGARALTVGAMAVEVLILAWLRKDGAANIGNSVGLLSLAAVCAYYDLNWLLARRAPANPLRLQFPLEHGTYAVVQGGRGIVFNHHWASRQQQYALDIVMPNESIAGKAVIAPIDGTVVALADDQDDEGSLSLRGAAVFGNYVAIEAEGGALIVLAHLRRGSVAVKVGDRVSAGQRLGEAGNSGRSSEPHLHIHVERDGIAVPATFNSRWLVRNSAIHS